MRATRPMLFAALAIVVAEPIAAQESGKEAAKAENPLPPGGSAGGSNHPDQNAKQESSSKVDGTAPVPEVFVNGLLTVAGAPTDVNTAPSTVSKRNAADDALPIAAYRFKHLTSEERTAVGNALRDERPSGSGGRSLNGFGFISAEVPTAVALEELKPVPDALVAQVPSLSGTTYTVSEGKVVLVNATTRVVVAVLE